MSVFNGWDKRIAILEATVGFLKDRLIALEAAIASYSSEVTRKVDKIETALGKQDTERAEMEARLENKLFSMHNQNQAWIRGVAYGIIVLLMYGLWSVLHMGTLKLP